MTLQEALSFTGNEYQAMTYEELVEVTRAMYEAARKRISRNVNHEGPAYEKLLGKAIGKGFTKKVKTINYVDGKIKISQNFKGSNKMDMSDLRTLRKVLTDFLRDPTSTKRGYNKYLKEQDEFFKGKIIEDVPEKKDDKELTIRDKFKQCHTDSDLLRFATNELDWGSSQKYAVIQMCGGYEALGTKEFVRKLRREIKESVEAIEKENKKFLYENKKKIVDNPLDLTANKYSSSIFYEED